jgi:hypothetical protein
VTCGSFLCFVSLGELGSHSLQALRPGQLILHSLARPLSASQSMQLSSLARLTHERHYNMRKFKREETYIPGGLACVGGGPGH